MITCQKLYSGKLAKGCKQCIKGRKSVLFITGLCHYKCFYCPISEDKRGKDLCKINEKIIGAPDTVRGLRDFLEECSLCQSRGVGITGGDPLVKTQRVCTYIKAAKKEFGKKFHTHLYTPLELVSKEKLQALYEAGLDEIRFHPNLEDDSLWKKMSLAKKFSWSVGVEIPAIPGLEKQAKKLLSFCKRSGFVHFVNLNELEYSDVGDDALIKRGLRVKDSLSYAITGSESLAERLVDFGRSIHLPVHYCSAQFKDAVQLANRFLLRAKKVAKDFDLVDKEGLLTRGEILTASPKKRLSSLCKEFSIPPRLVVAEEKRILIAPWILEKIAKNIPETCAIVKEYPTADSFVVEREILQKL